MMKTKIAITFLFIMALVSCKKEEKTAEPEVKKEVSTLFKVTLDVNVKKDDSFHLFYTEDGSSNFTEESSVWVEFKGSPNDQSVTFNLPENTIPTNLRLDFGVNKEQEEMTIKNFKMEYAGKISEAQGANFFNLFGPNEAITKVDKEKGLIIPVKDQAQYFGPSFYPLPALAEQIAKMVQ